MSDRSMPVQRPSPLSWLGYCFGAGLPERHRTWVLHDATGPSWVFRHVSRAVLQMSPIVFGIVLFVPGPLWIRMMSAFGGLVMGFVFSLGYMVETVEHRLVKAGYPAGTGEHVRSRRATSQRSDGVARRRAKMMERMDRRAGGTD